MTKEVKKKAVKKKSPRIKRTRVTTAQLRDEVGDLRSDFDGLEDRLDRVKKCINMVILSMLILFLFVVSTINNIGG